MSTPAPPPAPIPAAPQEKKGIWHEFKEFLNKGDIVTIAVGLILALYFAKIVDAILLGIVLPIIAAIFGKRDFSDIGFTINHARFSIGLVINAVISFVVVGFILFLIVKAYNAWRRTADDEGGDTELSVLREIREELRNRG
jgi:large conductance mechanosensitive channel